MIEVGDYVRTKKGLIAKVCAYQDLTTYDDKGISVTFHSFDTDKGAIADIDIARHREDIIDLIEAGDIVNGMIVEEFDDEEGNLYLGFAIYDDALMDCIEEVRPLNTIDIKTILTHEQYKNNAYEVEG